MFVIVVEYKGNKELCYDGRSVWISEDYQASKDWCKYLASTVTTPDATYTLCQVVPMPQEGP